MNPGIRARYKISFILIFWSIVLSSLVLSAAFVRQSEAATPAPPGITCDPTVPGNCPSNIPGQKSAPSTPTTVDTAIPAGCPGGPAGPQAPGTDCLNVKNKVAGRCDQLTADNKIISQGGFIRWLCGQTNNPNRNAIEVLVEVVANWLMQVGTVLLAVMIGLAGVQILTAGASPEALKAGKRRLTLAISSLSLLVLGRLIMSLIGITSTSFLGVELGSFSQTTILDIIAAIWRYIQYIGGVLTVAMIIYGGFIMLTSAGNPQRIQSARRVITYAVVGLGVLAGTTVILNLVSIALTGR